MDEKKLRRILFEEMSNVIKKEVTQKKVNIPDNIKDMTVGQLLDYFPAVANFIPGLSQASTAANLAAQYLPAAASALGSIGNVAKQMFGKGEELKAEEQTGCGDNEDDVTPEVPINFNQNMQKLIAPGDVQTFNENRPFFHKSDLLKRIPKRFHSKASQLLDYIAQNPLSIHWTENGVISVTGDQIPNSNIYVVFPELYKFHPNLKIPGLTNVLQYLCSYGLGHLIRKTKYWFLVRHSKSRKLNQIGKGLPKDIPWYYLG